MSKLLKGFIITIICFAMIASMGLVNLNIVAVDNEDPGKPTNVIVV